MAIQVFRRSSSRPAFPNEVWMRAATIVFIYHFHPHEQRTDSRRVGFRRIALQTAHSLIHMTVCLVAVCLLR